MNRPLSIDDCNCFALRQAARYVTQLYERHLGRAGVTPAQFSILSKLARQPARTIMDLSALMVMERTTLVRALKPLQRDGLVAATASTEDARTHVFSLTAHGESVLDDAAVAWSAAQREFHDKFGGTRAQALRTELFDLTAAA